jgi:hypothetical protein
MRADLIQDIASARLVFCSAKNRGGACLNTHFRYGSLSDSLGLKEIGFFERRIQLARHGHDRDTAMFRDNTVATVLVCLCTRLLPARDCGWRQAKRARQGSNSAQAIDDRMRRLSCVR